MAANFWKSSHFQIWIKGEPQTAKSIKSRRLRILLSEFTCYVGELCKARSKLVATANVYVKRYIFERALPWADLRLLCITSLHLASKTEEKPISLSGIHRCCSEHANSTTTTTSSTSNTSGPGSSAGWRAEMDAFLRSQVAEVSQIPIIEFVNQATKLEASLVDYLKFSLIVFHPYRCLRQYMVSAWEQTEEEDVQAVQALVNDSYRTDVCLHHPPYQIALACILIHMETRKYDHGWFVGLNPEVDRKSIEKVALEIMEMYELTFSSKAADFQELIKEEI